MIRIIMIAIGALLLISVLMLLFFPDQLTVSETDGDIISQEELKELWEEQKKAREDAAFQEPTPSGVNAQWLPAKEVKLFMESSNAIVLDVRTKEEYDREHIKGAKLIPLEELGERASADLPDKWRMILIYGRDSASCVQAAQILTDRMYMNIFVFGGIQSWPYDVIHPE